MNKNLKTAVLLSGCGVYDGAEIHESVLTLLALSQNNLNYICTAPDLDQNHVINHVNGEEMNEKRNVFIESSRISRGEICKLSELNTQEISSIVIIGGFGAAKNLSNWAFKGPNGSVINDVKNLIPEISRIFQISLFFFENFFPEKTTSFDFFESKLNRNSDKF